MTDVIYLDARRPFSGCYTPAQQRAAIAAVLATPLDVHCDDAHGSPDCAAMDIAIAMAEIIRPDMRHIFLDAVITLFGDDADDELED